MRAAQPLFALALAVTTLFYAPAAHAAGKAGKNHKAPAAKASAAKTAGNQVVFETSLGKVVVRLHSDKAPISSQNMLAYVDAGFYNNTIFHRVIPDFMIQGGGFTRELTQKPTRDAIKNEADNGLSNVRGTVAMARTDAVDSATAQFFINTKDNLQLDHRSGSFGYAVVGEVVEGMDVVDAIRRVPTNCPSWTSDGSCDPALSHGMHDVPKEPVTLLKAYRRK